MRPLRISLQGTLVEVAPKAWVTFRPLEFGAVFAQCLHCRSTQKLRGTQSEVQEYMGNFVQRHNRCPHSLSEGVLEGCPCPAPAPDAVGRAEPLSLGAAFEQRCSKPGPNPWR